jgi:hypothetical protein
MQGMGVCKSLSNASFGGRCPRSRSGSGSATNVKSVSGRCPRSRSGSTHERIDGVDVPSAGRTPTPRPSSTSPVIHIDVLNERNKQRLSASEEQEVLISFQEMLRTQRPRLSSVENDKLASIYRQSSRCQQN